MIEENSSIINIGLVGGGALCKEFLEKTTLDYNHEGINPPILAVADPNMKSQGIVLAKRLGLLAVSDYHELYDPKYDIQLIIVLVPDQHILEDILKTRPFNIRILSHHVFEFFWNAIGSEERKLRVRTNEMETIINGIQDLILVINPDMEIVDVNEALLKQMRSTRDQIIGQKCYKIFQKIDHRDAKCHAEMQNAMPSAP